MPRYTYWTKKFIKLKMEADLIPNKLNLIVTKLTN